MRILACSLLILVGGCGDNGTSGGEDLATSGGNHDLAMSTKKDMAGQPPVDMAGQPPVDMAGQPPVDMAGQQGSPDMATTMMGKFTTVVTVVLENTSYKDIVGNGQNAPYINGLIAQGGVATNYMDSGTHPSLPNYLYMVSGAPQYAGILDISPTTNPFPVDKVDLGQQLQVAGVPWRAYMDSMVDPCRITDNGKYATKHNPFVYFKYWQVTNLATCKMVDVDYVANFNDDLLAGKTQFMWITPDLNHDGHDTDLATADAWCKANIQPILDSQVFKDGGVLFLTWDEGGTVNFVQTDDHVPMIIVSPKIKQAGMQSATAYTHASYLATVEDIFGLQRLGAAAQAQNMNEFFQ
jgi:hypothetical protein